MKILDEERKLEKEINTRINDNGETHLHIVARSDNYKLLKKLIEKGYDVNVQDNGGWTPLSEAVSANKLQNVRLLLEKGARVDNRSNECLVDEMNEPISGSGQTPLMEACSNGNIKIANILICFKASTIQSDDDGWTCLDYLRQYIETNKNELTSKEIDDLKKFEKFIENKQRQVGYAPRTSPPPPRRSLQKFNLKKNLKRTCLIESDDDENRNLLKSFEVNEDKKNLNEYKRIIGSLQRNSDKVKNKNIKHSLADAKDEKLLEENNMLDRLREVLPADLDFLENDDLDNVCNYSKFGNRDNSLNDKNYDVRKRNISTDKTELLIKELQTKRKKRYAKANKFFK